KIDCGRLLASVATQEISGDADVALSVPRRPPVARVVAYSRPFDLDHVGAEVGQQLRAPRPCQHAAEVEDLDSVERLQCRRIQKRRSARTAWAALCPGAPVTPPPGCAPEPHRYRPLSGIR